MVNGSQHLTAPLISCSKLLLGAYLLRSKAKGAMNTNKVTPNGHAFV